MEICQCTQAGNSKRMEKFAFVKVLNRLKNENIKIEMLTTDRHSQIRKHMREEEKISIASSMSGIFAKT